MNSPLILRVNKISQPSTSITIIIILLYLTQTFRRIQIQEMIEYLVKDAFLRLNLHRLKYFCQIIWKKKSKQRHVHTLILDLFNLLSRFLMTFLKSIGFKDPLYLSLRRMFCVVAYFLKVILYYIQIKCLETSITLLRWILLVCQNYFDKMADILSHVS